MTVCLKALSSLIYSPKTKEFNHLIDTKIEKNVVTVVIPSYQKTCFEFLVEVDTEPLTIDIHSTTRIISISIFYSRTLLFYIHFLYSSDYSIFNLSTVYNSCNILLIVVLFMKFLLLLLFSYLCL